jgi:hypothetical protein
MDFCKHAIEFSPWTTINARIIKFTFLLSKFDFLNAGLDMIVFSQSEKHSIFLDQLRGLKLCMYWALSAIS